MEKEDKNIYEKIIDHFRNQGLEDDEIALNILRDTTQIPLIDFALESLSEEEALSYYDSILEHEITEYKSITTEEFDKLFEKYKKGEEFNKDELDKFLYKFDGGYTAIDNTYGNLFTEDFKDRNIALRYLAGEDLDKLREEECKYEVNIYETPEDYDKGEPFQLNVYSNLNEAINDLNNTIKFNNFYAGNVLNQETGEEEYSNIPDENIEDLDDEEEDEL